MSWNSCLSPGSAQVLLVVFLHFRSFIVIVSFALELAFHWATHDGSRGITRYINILQLWRLVWIGHGLVASTYEIEEHRHCRLNCTLMKLRKCWRRRDVVNLTSLQERVVMQQLTENNCYTRHVHRLNNNVMQSSSLLSYICNILVRPWVDVSRSFICSFLLGACFCLRFCSVDEKLAQSNINVYPVCMSSFPRIVPRPVAIHTNWVTHS